MVAEAVLLLFTAAPAGCVVMYWPTRPTASRRATSSGENRADSFSLPIFCNALM
ncbi:hypothetical protein D3C72_2308600 [compost metagenome]